MDANVSWDVDRRKRSLYTHAYVLAMRLNRDKSAFEGADQTLRTAARKQRAGDAPPTWWTRVARRVSTDAVAGMTVWTARPRHRRPVVRVLYLHGGGYLHPLTADYWRLVRALCGVPAEIVVPAYPLAPRATVDDVLPRLLDLEGAVASRDDHLPTVLMGDSAGGALALDLARSSALTRRPAAVIALCPWLDATLAEDAVRDLEATDPMLAESGLRVAGRLWAGNRSPADPVVSPVNSSLEGLPPVHVYIGDYDILRPAVDELAARARADNARLHVHEVSAMFHVWMTRAIPEARRTRRELVVLLRRTTAGQVLSRVQT